MSPHAQLGFVLLVASFSFMLGYFLAGAILGFGARPTNKPRKHEHDWGPWSIVQPLSGREADKQRRTCRGKECGIVEQQMLGGYGGY